MVVKKSDIPILEVMNKELKAIVWFGTLLGFFMAWINRLL